jgi:hypothetical protein
MSDENVPMAAWAPKKVWEVPEKKLTQGELIQHDGSNDSALKIVAWLLGKGISAFAVPQYAGFPAFIRINAMMEPLTVGEDEYVYLPEGANQHPQILPWHKAQRRFRTEGDTTPVGDRNTSL